jgi:hypothetical protein
MSDQELDALHESFAAVLAECEMALPLNWCTITHHLLLHIAKVFKDLGAFWAHNNLPTERLHVKLKNLARSCLRIYACHFVLLYISIFIALFVFLMQYISIFIALIVFFLDVCTDARDKMASLGKHYDLFDATQTEWRLENRDKWTTKPAASTLASLREISTNDGVVVAKGVQIPGSLSRAEMEQVKNLWATECKGFDALKDRYAAEATAYRGRKRKRAQKNKGQFPRFRNWTPRGATLTDEENRWTQMSKDVQVFSFV